MIKIVLCTVDEPETAHKLARELVNRRLAACVNIIPKVSSVYKWKGELEVAEEVLLLAKTSPERVPDLIQQVSQLHPYDVPEILTLPVDQGLGAYLDWVLAETKE